jgi:hypothetical protein
MRVAVDQARGEEPPAAIDGLAVFILGRILAWAGPGDAAVLHEDSAIRDQPIGLAAGHGCELEVGKKHQKPLV